MKKRISGGIYLVLDPSIEKTGLIRKLKEALEGGTDIIQIWNHWPDSFTQSDKEDLIDEILEISNSYDIPVLINDNWKMLISTELDGVHFDDIPGDFDQIQNEIQKEFIAGITCSNDLDVIRWADKNDFDYISFCSMFPSSSVDSCEIVRAETVHKAREITDLPLFVSGGITPENLADLKELDFQGIAVISGILTADSPKKSAKDYQKILNEMSSFAPKGSQGKGGEKRKSVLGG